MIKINKQDLSDIVKMSFSKSEVLRHLGYNYYNSRLGREIAKIIDEYNIDISHFLHSGRYTLECVKYEVVEKKCPVCGENFTTKKGHSKEKTTCSYACSNTYFRSGTHHPKWNGSVKNYAKKAFREYEHKCARCGFDKKYALQVHHIDKNRDNNDIKNLIILCANCHSGVHKNIIKL